MKHIIKTAEDIISSYNKELSLLRQLLIITESMKGLVQNPLLERIGRKIQEREDIINQIKLIEKRLIPHRKRRQSQWEEISPQLRDNAQSLLKRIREIIQRIQTLDMETQAILNDDREKVACRLKKVSLGHKIIKLYAPFRVSIPRYLSQAV